MIEAGSPESTFFHLAILAVVQGITEFLPISSSAHLILVPTVMGWTDQGLAIDVAMHIGTLMAVILYFRADVGRLVRGGIDVLQRRRSNDARLSLQISAATIPVVIAGFLLKDLIADDWRNPSIIAVTTIVFGVVLWIADRRARSVDRSFIGMSWRVALLIGLAQTLALVPGVSRSSITMTAALFLGQSRSEAARFSLLLSIPTTAAAGMLGGYELIQSGDASLQFDALVAGLLAFLSALAAIAGLMAWLKRATFMPFVVYRLILGGIISAGLYWGFF